MKKLSLPSIVAWALTLGFATLLRMDNALSSIVGEEVLSGGPDSAYHARRMLETWAHYPRVPTFDRLLDWPRGAAAPWPPGFDFSVATLAAWTDDRFVAVFVISAAPVLFGLALVVLTASATRLLHPEAPWWTPWLAGTLLGLFPQTVSVARFGNTDHHVAEGLILTSLGMWSAWAFAALSGELTLAKRLRIEIAAALLAAAAQSLFIGATMYIAIAGASVALANVLYGRGAWHRFGVGAPGLLVGAGLALLTYLPFIHAHGRVTSYVYPSYVQPALIATVGLGCGVASLLGLTWTRLGQRRALMVSAAGAIVIGLCMTLSTTAREVLHGLYEWFADSESPLAQLSENQPLFSAHGEANVLSRAHRYYGVVGPLLPLLVPAGLLVHVRARGARAALPFLCWTLAITALMLLQNRFGRVGAVNLAICTALLVRVGLQRLPVGAPWLACALPIVLVLMLGESAYRRDLTPQQAPVTQGIQEAAMFLRTEPRRVERGQRAGVLVPWDQAHYVVRYGERPVTATGFGVYVAPDAVDALHHIWSSDEAHMLSFASARDLGFVAFHSSTFTTRLWHGRGPLLGIRGGQPAWNEEYFRSVPLVTLLLGGSGISGIGVPHVRSLLPRFAAATPASGLPASTPSAWVYEIVPGAKVVGDAPPNTLVQLRTQLHVRGHAQVHEAWARSGPSGRFELVTPLPSNYRAEGLQTAATGRLRIGDAPARDLHVTEAQVRQGASIRLSP